MATSHPGFTVIETAIVLTVVGLVMAIAYPSLRSATDAAATRSAAQDAGAAFGLARKAAVARRQLVTVRLDSTTGTILVRTGGETLLTRPVRERYGVGFRSTRDSMAFDQRGLGYGAANLSVVFSRGHAAETLFVARLGRIRR